MILLRQKLYSRAVTKATNKAIRNSIFGHGKTGAEATKQARERLRDYSGSLPASNIQNLINAKAKGGAGKITAYRKYKPMNSLEKSMYGPKYPGQDEMTEFLKAVDKLKPKK